jgi:hypothetical protein
MNVLNSPGRQDRFVANPIIAANSVTQSAKAVHKSDVGAVGSVFVSALYINIRPWNIRNGT